MDKGERAESKTLNLWSIALEHLDSVAERLHLEERIHRKLRHPKRILTVSIPMVMDDGRMEVFTGHRVHHNVARGPAKGGIRYHPDVTLDAELADLPSHRRFTTARAAAIAIGTLLDRPPDAEIREEEILFLVVCLSQQATAVR